MYADGLPTWFVEKATGPQPTSQNLLDIELRQGRFGAVRSLLRVLEGGGAAKAILDLVVDASSAMQNLREAISSMPKMQTQYSTSMLLEEGVPSSFSCQRATPQVNVKSSPSSQDAYVKLAWAVHRSVTHLISLWIHSHLPSWHRVQYSDLEVS